jgi:hypothetical protein
MTAAVFCFLLVCLLTMRFFFTCLIVLLIGVFVLSDQPPARAEMAKCDPAFVTVNAELTYATTMCNKNYMDTKAAIDINELAHECDAPLGKKKIRALMRSAMRNWDNVAREQGKTEACAITDRAFNAAEAASAPTR